MNGNWKFDRRLAMLVPALLLAFVFVACSTNQPPNDQLDDSAITASIKAKYATDDDVKAHNIDVDTVNGVVTLSGVVDTAEEKAKAARIAAETDGVRRVNNTLQIKS